MDKKKNSFSLMSLFTLRTSIKMSFIICLITQLCFFFVCFHTDLSQKWIGFFLHFINIVIALLSLSFLYEMTVKSFIRLRFMTQLSAITEFGVMIYYSFQLFSMWKSEAHIDLILFFVFTLIILGLFKGLLISAIVIYLKTIKERPMMIQTKGKSDKTFDDNKIKQLKEDLIGY